MYAWFGILRIFPVFLYPGYLNGSVFFSNLGLDLYICNIVNYADYRKDEIK